MPSRPFQSPVATGPAAGAASGAHTAVPAQAASARGGARITLRSVTKRFTNRGGAHNLVMRDIDLDIEPERVTCLVGPSGCGKTTLLNMIAGFEPVTSGQIELDGTPITTIGPDRAVVFQQPALFPWMDVTRNVLAAAKAQGHPVDECRPAAAALIHRMGLAGSEHLYPYQLSGGMKQRVQIARALLGRPNVLLMDEPFGALDAQTRLSLQELMLELLRTERPTVVFVTHDVEEATLLGNHIVVMGRAPARVRERIDVDVPEPRSYRTVTDPKFVATKEHLLALVHESARS